MVRTVLIRGIKSSDTVSDSSMWHHAGDTMMERLALEQRLRQAACLT